MPASMSKLSQTPFFHHDETKKPVRKINIRTEISISSYDYVARF